MEKKTLTQEELKKVTGGCDHMNHNICCRCGHDCSPEMERTYCKKWTVDKEGDRKYHYFCIKCVRELGL